ncbi:hypothetical protein [Sporomusa sp. KB1]|jgi:hypothetical protein|uniref:hypothetical protein n=1 Tax=Sporomusa sp. KB1 TaxID=943346 RepID=UPI0011A0ACD1|nr:hypothetical protein [Sporomusa sp. KB1]TWH48545.1 hypothetical protein Salpa_4710 [Sporomusa sp. KB1]
MPRNDDLHILLAEYQRKYGELSDEVIELIKKYISEGKTAKAAVSQALKETGFFIRHESELIAIITNAAIKGFGQPGTDNAELRKVLLHEAWAPDKMNLSKRLHGARPEIRQIITDSLATSMRLGKAWIQTARDLYDGYGYGHKTVQADLPEYLKRLVAQSRKVLAGDKTAMEKYLAAIKQAESQIKKLAVQGAPTKALKAAYGDLLDATKRMNQEAMERAIKVAVEEKSRYIADRIARTEISAAWGEAFFAKHLYDPDVIAFRWVLNSRHPRYDICDIYATVDMFGLGPGVYPKGKYPRRPAHPHCMCPIEPIYVGEFDIDPNKESQIIKNAKFNPSALDKFLESLPREKQLQLLGVSGLKAWQMGDAWQNHLRLWAGMETPKSRFSSNDFNEQLSRNMNNAKIESDMLNKAKRLRKQIISNGPEWKPGKLDKHVDKRKRYGHIPSDWTSEDYNNQILHILSNETTEVYWYHKTGFLQNYFVYGLPDWVVIVGEDGVMESAFIIDQKNYYDYLTEEEGFKKLGTVGRLEHAD